MNVKLRITRPRILTGITALLLGSTALEGQTIVDPPEDQGALANGIATFTVEPKVAGLAYQWVRVQADGYVELSCETNKCLVLSNVGIDDVGFYSCIITDGDQTEFTKAASLTVAIPSGASDSEAALIATGGAPLLLYAAPVVGSGTKGSCPGAYSGYVSYTLPTAQGWGWAPSSGTTVHTASDVTRTDTKVEYVGKYGDWGCAQTSVTVPHPTVSPKYRFAIYFPNSVPSTNYPILLEGFNQ